MILCAATLRIGLISSELQINMAQGTFFSTLNANQKSDTNTSSAGDPLDVTRSIIDRDIASLEESIRALKSRRNELSPISRLPAESLCKTFSLFEDNSIFYSGQTYNFSQVSQHWRSSALSAGTLSELSINQILHALQRMPALTDLHLIDSIPNDSEGSSTCRRSSLPSATSYFVWCGVLTTVLHHITFPLSAILNCRVCSHQMNSSLHFSDI